MERIWARLRAALSMPSMMVVLLFLTLVLLLRSGMGGETSQVKLERQLEIALSQLEGAGRVQVIIRMLHAEGNAEGSAWSGKDSVRQIPCGAIAIAQGAHDPLVCMRITRALCAILGLQASQVDVLSASGG